MNALHRVAQPGADKSRLAPKAVERWQRIALQALKQCKRDFAVQIIVHPDIKTAAAANQCEGSVRLTLLPDAERGFLDAVMAAHADRATDRVAFAVGGEQGLAPAELDVLGGAGFIPAHCGSGILRAYTAALTATAVAALVRG